jgi:uncharacterized protein GlcG (DUF336 family)
MKPERLTTRLMTLCCTAAALLLASSAAAAQETPSALSLATAQKLVQGALDHARARNQPLTVVVVDAGGHVLAAARMDGSPFGTFDVARGKAIASVATGGVSGAALVERYKQNPIIFGQISSLRFGGPMFPSQGSLPIFMNGVLVGAAGASGAPSQVDEDAVRAGLKAIGAAEQR